VDYVYLWADGIDVNIRLEEHTLCVLVLIGVRANGHKELVALADSYRESTESWGTCCVTAPGAGCVPPVLAVGDGALGGLVHEYVQVSDVTRFSAPHRIRGPRGCAC
jgi:transposase-like protein